MKKNTMFDRANISREFFESSDGFILYGAGQLGRKCQAAIEASGRKVFCYVDGDPSKWYKEYFGKMIYPPVEAYQRFKNATTFITIWAPRFDPMEVKNWLMDRGASSVFSFQILYELFDGVLPHYQFAHSNYFLDQQERISKFYEKLSDNESKEIYANQISWRINRGQVRLLPPSFHDQYLPSKIVTPEMCKYFVDCGAFDGDTAKAVLKFAHPHIKKIYSFEPDSSNYKKLSNWHSSLSNDLRQLVIPENLATGSSDCLMAFSSIGTTGSSLIGDSLGDTKVTKIDTYVQSNPVSYIKMDVEGYELDVIEGAINTIKKNRPVLGVCVYHKPDDIYSIGEYIDSLNLNYSFYMRSHDTQGLELVLYCVPN